MNKYNNFINFEELAILYLQEEQNLKYEQLTLKIGQEQAIIRRSLKASYQIFNKAVENIEFCLKNLDNLSKGKDSTGNYLEFSYDIFKSLNKLCSKDMQILYTTNCLNFSENSVRLYIDFHKFLLQANMIEKIISYSYFQ